MDKSKLPENASWLNDVPNRQRFLGVVLPVCTAAKAIRQGNSGGHDGKGNRAKMPTTGVIETSGTMGTSVRNSSQVPLLSSLSRPV
jgi:hypothetical protein